MRLFQAPPPPALLVVSLPLPPISHRFISRSILAPFDYISSPIHCDKKDPQISEMNRLRKTDSRRGKGVHGIHSPSVHAVPTAGPATTRAQARATGFPQHVGVAGTGSSPVGGWWAMPSPSEGIYPPGGFSNFLQSNPFANHPNRSENFHFVGAGMSQSSVSPIDLGATRTPPPPQQTDDIVVDLDGEEEDETINIHETSRTDKRLPWLVPDDKRLASAWLRNSKDPVDGNDKKADAYWADVTKEFNKTTESCRQRNKNQLKIRWDRCKKPLTDFHGYWVNASRVWQSGMSDDQLTDKALEMWAGKNDGKAFHLLHMWKVVRGDQKWSAYLAKLKKEKEKGKGKNATATPAHLVDLELEGEKRPMGHRKAKKQRLGKNKSSDVLADFSGKIDKFIEASTKNKEDREKMTEIQQSLADKRIEAARLNHEAAHEQTKCKMLETYTQLLLAPTDQLSADALAERNKAVERLTLALFPK